MRLQKELAAVVRRERQQAEAIGRRGGTGMRESPAVLVRSPRRRKSAECPADELARMLERSASSIRKAAKWK